MEQPTNKTGDETVYRSASQSSAQAKPSAQPSQGTPPKNNATATGSNGAKPAATPQEAKKTSSKKKLITGILGGTALGGSLLALLAFKSNPDEAQPADAAASPVPPGTAAGVHVNPVSYTSFASGSKEADTSAKPDTADTTSHKQPHVVLSTTHPVSDQVMDDLTPEEAMRQAREQGDMFFSHGNEIRPTFTEEEWTEMSTEKKQEFLMGVNLNSLPGEPPTINVEGHGEMQVVLPMLETLDKMVITKDAQDHIFFIDSHGTAILCEGVTQDASGQYIYTNPDTGEVQHWTATMIVEDAQDGTFNGSIELPGPEPVVTDFSLVSNYIDTDGDGVADTQVYGFDTDNDGIIDFQDNGDGNFTVLDPEVDITESESGALVFNWSQPDEPVYIEPDQPVAEPDSDDISTPADVSGTGADTAADQPADDTDTTNESHHHERDYNQIIADLEESGASGRLKIHTDDGSVIKVKLHPHEQMDSDDDLSSGHPHGDAPQAHEGISQPDDVINDDGSDTPDHTDSQDTTGDDSSDGSIFHHPVDDLSGTDDIYPDQNNDDPDSSHPNNDI